VAATVASAILFGVLPAWQASNTDPVGDLKDGRGGTGSLGDLRSGRYLVGLQLALSLPLVLGAGLLARTVYNLQHADLGFPAHHLLLARVDLRAAAPDLQRRQIMAEELLRDFRTVPGVRAVTYSQLGLFSGGESTASIAVEGHTPRNENESSSGTDVVGPGYFSTLGIPIVLGREILESDSAQSTLVCVINEAFARRFFEGLNPIGMQIALTHEERHASYRVVGVVKDARTASLREAVEPRFFVAGDQDANLVKSPTYLIRTAGSASVALAVRKVIQRVDPDLPFESVASIEDQMAPLTAQDRATAQLALAFGLVALALAAIGLYGVLSYGIARRTGEIAIRIALGSKPSGVIGMILRESAGLVLGGLAIGGGLAGAGARLIGSRLYGITPEDPFTLTLAAGVLSSVALVAAYLPARRASKLDPMVALRGE